MRRWLAEDYDLIEELLHKGLPPLRIAALLDPPSTPENLRLAMTAAGLRSPVKRGRPSNADRRRWAEREREILHDRGLTERIDASKREQIARFADQLGYQVVITEKPPED